MPQAPQRPEVQPQPARAAMVGSSARCPVCQGPLPEGRKTCSGRCRAALSRRQREEVEAQRDREISAMIGHAETLYQRAAELLQRARGGSKNPLTNSEG